MKSHNTISSMIFLSCLAFLLISCGLSPQVPAEPTKEAAVTPTSVPAATATSTIFNYSDHPFNGLSNCGDLRLSDLKGSNVMLVLFSVRCSHCQDEAQHLTKIQRDYKSQGLEIIVLEVSGADRETLRAFARDYHLTMPVCADPDQEFSSRMGIKAVPTSLFFTSDGVLSQSKIGFKDETDLRQTIDQFLTE
ncbi:MAG: redoxin domain-containing protein [Anaerolineaceae bacterium]|nr:redoxin domain-containing protein [Anaerolineaceae bacterium]